MSAVLLSACASLPAMDPPRVTLADIDSVAFEGMELRMLVRLRVQNPNGIALDYDGIDVQVSLQGKGVARGVSDERGSVPRYGEAIIVLPVTVSLMDLGRQALGIFNGADGRIHYAIEGKLGGTLLGATRFHSQGEVSLPLPGTPADAAADRDPERNPL
ncbi:MAG TPA: LEA type 2 family protein [Usitatibacter sp.]|jgi:LEA14-like dessication related protein|nr:LEA type 2 family protein [Usitatibacter sp.]